MQYSVERTKTVRR